MKQDLTTDLDVIIRAALVRAIRRRESIYVVYEDHQLDTATEYDMDTYYQGAQVIGIASPDGTWEHA